MTMVRNRPTDEGRELGTELARMAQAEIDALAEEGEIVTPCNSCAFRAGTVPNGCVATLTTALKCVMEVEPFYCHETPESDRGICQGWAASVLKAKEVVIAPWDFIEGADK